MHGVVVGNVENVNLSVDNEVPLYKLCFTLCYTQRYELCYRLSVPGPCLPYPRAFPSLIVLPQRKSGCSCSTTSENQNCSDASADSHPTALYLVGGFIGVADVTLNDVIPVSTQDITRLILDQGQALADRLDITHQICILN